MRTGLALLGFGFVVARFGLSLREIAAAQHMIVHQRSTGWSLWIGTALIGLGVAVSLLASWEYFRFGERAKTRPALHTPHGHVGDFRVLDSGDPGDHDGSLPDRDQLVMLPGGRWSADRGLAAGGAGRLAAWLLEALQS